MKVLRKQSHTIKRDSNTIASNKTIVELDPVVLSSKLMEAFLFGLDAKGYKQVENTYEI